MRLTPAYLESVATLLRHARDEPGRRATRVYVCTNISCSLRGADELLRDAERGRRGRPGRQRARVRVPRRVRHRADGLRRRRLRRPARAPRRAQAARGRARRRAGAARQAARPPPVADPRANSGEYPLHDARSRTRASAMAMQRPMLLFKDIDEPGLNTLAVYERRGGYESLRRALADDAPRRCSPSSKPRSSAAAAAPASRWARRSRSCRRAAIDKYLVCNADESEPGTFKDRELMQKTPHTLIEGIVIAAYAAGRQRARSSTSAASTCCRPTCSTPRSPKPARPATSARTSSAPSHSLSLVVHRGAGAYICGEETGLLDSLEGKRGNPRLKPPFPANQGLYQGPTLINNVETLSTVPTIIGMGGAEYAKLGVETLDRHQARLRLRATCSGPATTRSNSASPRARSSTASPAAPPTGRSVKCWFPGGSSSPVLTARGPRHRLRLRLARESRHDARLRRDHRRRRLHADPRRRAEGREVLPPRVLRQVHARAARARTGR